MFVIPIIPVTPAILVTLFPALTLVGRQKRGASTAVEAPRKFALRVQTI